MAERRPNPMSRTAGKGGPLPGSAGRAPWSIPPNAVSLNHLSGEVEWCGGRQLRTKPLLGVRGTQRFAPQETLRELTSESGQHVELGSELYPVAKSSIER
jgi:hypothetical protein